MTAGINLQTFRCITEIGGKTSHCDHLQIYGIQFVLKTSFHVNDGDEALFLTDHLCNRRTNSSCPLRPEASDLLLFLKNIAKKNSRKRKLLCLDICYVGQSHCDSRRTMLGTGC